MGTEPVRYGIQLAAKSEIQFAVQLGLDTLSSRVDANTERRKARVIFAIKAELVVMLSGLQKSINAAL